MFLDIRDLPVGACLEGDVCIVGAGAAGISIAQALADTRLRILLLEAGGEVPDASSRAIYRIVPRWTQPLTVDPSQRWYFGGNTNHWAGNCSPLTDADFEPRDWVPFSGWPFRQAELLPFYRRAQAVFGVGDFEYYDIESCRPWLTHQPLEIRAAVLRHHVLQIAPEPSLAELFRRRLSEAGNVQVCLRAQAVALATDRSGERVEAVQVAAPGGRRFDVRARSFVLAGGAIENARLLLCSDAVQAAGLGNEHDLVGRFFMEHPWVELPLEATGVPGDIRFHSGSAAPQPAGSAMVWGQLHLAAPFLRAERLIGIGVSFRPSAMDAPSVISAARLKDALLRRESVEHPTRELRNVLWGIDDIGRHLARRIRPRAAPRAGALGTLRLELEQTPDPANRVRIASERDDLGQRRALLEYRFSRADRRNHARALPIIAAELGLDGRRLGRRFAQALAGDQVGFYWHHMGTTRMHADPRCGVVDAQCRVHGVANLFVAGSSVFPTGGASGPTLTIVALALRLADRLRELEA
jgi:choline dehydrogenase-like flavoprotein